MAGGLAQQHLADKLPSFPHCRFHEACDFPLLPLPVLPVSPVLLLLRLFTNIPLAALAGSIEHAGFVIFVWNTVLTRLLLLWLRQPSRWWD